MLGGGSGHKLGVPRLDHAPSYIRLGIPPRCVFYYPAALYLPLGSYSNGSANMYKIGNIYGITAISVIGGGLFGFDISSMSAMYVSTTWDCGTKLTET